MSYMYILYTGCCHCKHSEWNIYSDRPKPNVLSALLASPALLALPRHVAVVNTVYRVRKCAQPVLSATPALWPSSHQLHARKASSQVEALVLQHASIVQLDRRALIQRMYLTRVNQI